MHSVAQDEDAVFLWQKAVKTGWVYMQSFCVSLVRFVILVDQNSRVNARRKTSESRQTRQVSRSAASRQKAIFRLLFG